MVLRTTFEPRDELSTATGSRIIFLAEELNLPPCHWVGSMCRGTESRGEIDLSTGATGRLVAVSKLGVRGSDLSTGAIGRLMADAIGVQRDRLDTLGGTCRK